MGYFFKIFKYNFIFRLTGKRQDFNLSSSTRSSWDNTNGFEPQGETTFSEFRRNDKRGKITKRKIILNTLLK